MAVMGGNGLVTGTDNDDTLWGMGGDDTLMGMGGNDLLEGQGGADKIDGGSLRDPLILPYRSIRESCWTEMSRTWKCECFELELWLYASA